MHTPEIRIFGTNPPYRNARSARDHMKLLSETARWAEQDGWEAMLVYTSNIELDPWLVAQAIIANTERLIPLVAVQPAYKHPFAVANTVLSLQKLYSRRVYLNMVAGDFPFDRAALGDTLPHDRRYDRVVEYASIVKSLLCRDAPSSFQGKYYNIKHLKLSSCVPSDMRPELTISGSSDAGMAAARTLGAIPIKYPRPSSEYGEAVGGQTTLGIRIGVIARSNSSEAWDVARKRYPESRDKAELRSIAIRDSDSTWVKDFLQQPTLPEGHPYWVSPYQNFHSSCPFLVGSQVEVAHEIKGYIAKGVRLFLLEAPRTREDSENITATFEIAKTA